MKKRTIIIGAFLVTMLAGGMTGCGSSGSDTKLTVWTNMSVEADTIQKYADEWGE